MKNYLSGAGSGTNQIEAFDFSKNIILPKPKVQNLSTQSVTIILLHQYHYHSFKSKYYRLQLSEAPP